MKKIIQLIAAGILCSFSLSAFGQNEATVMQTAQNDLQKMLNQIPPGQLENFGFNDRAEFAIATVGKPYRMLTFSMGFYKGDMDWHANDFIEAQQKWRVPVIVNGQQRMLLTVDARNGACETVDMGAVGLAAELQQKSKNASANSQYCLLRIYPLEADFFVDVNGNAFENARFTPLYSATMSMPALAESGTTSLGLNDVMPLIKDALKNHLKN